MIDRKAAVEHAQNVLLIALCNPPAQPAQTLLARAVIEMAMELDRIEAEHKPWWLHRIGRLLGGKS